MIEVTTHLQMKRSIPARPKKLPTGCARDRLSEMFNPNQRIQARNSSVSLRRDWN